MTAALPPRDCWPAMVRGWWGRCPHCGEGRMFRAFLKVADHCPACGEALHHQRADDAPAYFVILIVGHIVVPLTLSVEAAYAPSYWLHAAMWTPPLSSSRPQRSASVRARPACSNLRPAGRARRSP